MRTKTYTYKALSALLSYPTREMKAASEQLRDVLRSEAAIPPSALRSLERLLDDLRDMDLYDLQERYVFLFDRTRSLSLHMFEHVHGESRDRGQAMVDLKTLYEQSGLDVDAKELPDFIPMFLEFLALKDAREARALLIEPLSVLTALKERLQKRKSPYAAVFRALEAIAGSEASIRELEELRKAPDDDPNDFEALDAAWEDQPVTFGPGEAACPMAENIVRRFNDDAAATAKEQSHG